MSRMDRELAILIVVLTHTRTLDAGDWLVLRRAHPYSVIGICVPDGEHRLVEWVHQIQLRIGESEDREALPIREDHRGIVSHHLSGECSCMGPPSCAPVPQVCPPSVDSI